MYEQLLPAQGGSSEYMTMNAKGLSGCNNQEGKGANGQCIDSEYAITNGG